MGWLTTIKAWAIYRLAGKPALDVWLAEWEHQADPATPNRLTDHGKAQIRRICAHLRDKFGVAKSDNEKATG